MLGPAERALELFGHRAGTSVGRVIDTARLVAGVPRARACGRGMFCGQGGAYLWCEMVERKLFLRYKGSQLANNNFCPVLVEQLGGSFGAFSSADVSAAEVDSILQGQCLLVLEPSVLKEAVKVFLGGCGSLGGTRGFGRWLTQRKRAQFRVVP